MCKKADLSLAVGSIVTDLSTVPALTRLPEPTTTVVILPGRMHPILKHIMSVRTVIPSWALTILPSKRLSREEESTGFYIFHIDASNGCVFKACWISAPGLFACMGKRTNSPVMRFRSLAVVNLDTDRLIRGSCEEHKLYLEMVHPKLVSREFRCVHEVIVHGFTVLETATSLKQWHSRCNHLPYETRLIRSNTQRIGRRYEPSPKNLQESRYSCYEILTRQIRSANP